MRTIAAARTHEINVSITVLATKTGIAMCLGFEVVDAMVSPAVPRTCALHSSQHFQIPLIRNRCCSCTGIQYLPEGMKKS